MTAAVEPQILITASGEELVVLPRRDYDVLLARLGDEDAEDRLLGEMADKAHADLASGKEFLLPVWFSDGLMANRSPLQTVREHFPRTPAEMATAAAITEAQLEEFERGTELPPAAILDAISADVGMDPRILRAIMYDASDA